MSQQQQQQQQRSIVYANFDVAMTFTTSISSKGDICEHVCRKLARIFRGDERPSPFMFSIVSAMDVASITRSPFLVLWYLLMQTVDLVDSALLETISVLCIRQVIGGCVRDVTEASAMMTGLPPSLLSSFSSDLVRSPRIRLKRDDAPTWRARCSALLSSVSKAGIAGNCVTSLNLSHTGAGISRFSIYYNGDSQILARALEA